MGEEVRYRKAYHLQLLELISPTDSAEEAKMTEGIAGTVLALGPWNLLHLHSAARTIDPSHGVEKIHWDIPKGNESEASLFERVIP